MPTFRTLLPAALLAASLPVFAAKQYEEMDYGRFLTASWLTQEVKGADGKTIKGRSTLETKTGCATNKGIAVQLGDKQGGMLFDTDLCRMSGGWSGAWVKLHGVVFDGGHGPNPRPADDGKMFFQIDPGPGWSKGDDFADPRALPTGPGAAKVPFGPLPREWAKYRGLYLNGDKIVLTYTVGTAGVMEMPALEKSGDIDVLTRTFNIVAGGTGASVVLADAPAGTTATTGNGVAVVSNSAVDADSRTVITVLGAPEGSVLGVSARTGTSPEASGPRITLKLPQLAQGTKFKVVYARGASADVAKLTEAAGKAEPAGDLAKLKTGGPAHWPETVTTAGTLGTDAEAYTVDTITVPFDNPYKSWMRIGGFDFFKDGKRAAVCTWSGDVWIVSGIDSKLEKIEWKRYATGLFQALGLKIVDDKIYVLGRDQITRLSDLNGDNEADWYECFNNDVQVTPGFHEFAFDLQTDPQGNFYTAKAGPVNPGGSGWGPLGEHNGCLFKISKDGSKFEVFATGVRAPNGIGVGPNGEVTTGDNQGTWVPACYVHLVKQGEFIGVTDLAHRKEVPTDYSRHICFLPMDTDNSGGGQTWVTSDKWGPLQGSLLHASYGKGTLHAILQEKVGDTVQGGAYKLPVKFESGMMRPRFNAVDGQLYIVGLKGWQTNGSKDAAFQRVRYTGKPVTYPNALKVTDKGITIGFTGALDTAAASDAQNYNIEQWNYQWTKNYGSPEFKVSDPKVKGHDPVEVKSVTVNPDKKSVFLEIPGLQPVMQMSIKMNLKSSEGASIPDRIVNTINVVGKE
jgi:hypothetical protein